MAGELISPNLHLNVFTDFSGGRDDLGAAIDLHTGSERKAYLKRNPQIDAQSLPPVRDVNARPTISDAVGSVNGQPVRTPERIRKEAARGALLAVPALVRSAPTKPRKAVEQSLHRTCCHELGHLLLTKLPIARITVERNGSTLGQVFTANRPATFETLIMLVAGRAAERVAYGRADELSGVDLKLTRELAEKLAPAQGVTPDRLIELANEAAFDALRGPKVC